MKKLKLNLAALALCLLAYLPSQAQLPSPLQNAICGARLQATVSGGISSVNTSDDYFDYSSRPAVVVGAMVPVPLSESVSLIPGIAYETKGATSQLPDYGFEEFPELGSLLNGAGRMAAVAGTAATQAAEWEDSNIRSYLSLPWMIGLRPISDLRSLSFNLGMNNSILLGNKVKQTRSGAENTVSTTENIRKINLGLLVGVSYQITPVLAAGVLYDHGLTNVSTLDQVEIRDRVFRLTLGYTFHFNPIFWESYSKRGRQKMKMYN